jgi:DNA-binding MarR family transcriptional regulator
MPRELTDADYQHLLDLRTGLRRFLRWSEEQAAEAGLTPAQHQLLLAIRGHLSRSGSAGAGSSPGSTIGPTIGDVAESLLLRHHSAVGLVDRAVKAGLVTRQEDATDRRVVRLRLTALGNDLLTLLSAAHLEELERLAPRMLELWP